MYLKVLLLAATVATCWANLNMLELDKIPTALHRLMTISRATLDEYDSPTLPCNEEGFYSHTSDCTKFYKCIDVLGNNDYQWLAFECHAGTIFSPEYQSCISGNCSKGLTSAASVSAALASASSAVAVSAMASSNASTAASAVTSVGRQVIDSSSISSEYGISQCNSSGRFGDPDDCGKYYDCVPSHNGTFIAHEKSCLGHAFHSTLQTCVPLRMVKGCIPFSIRMLTVDPNFQVLCNNSQNKFICADCKTLVMCIEGNPYPKSCAAGNVCSMKNSSFNSGVCRPRDPVSCTCDEDYILRVDVYNSSKFLSCGIKGRDPIIYTCPKDLFFNNQCGACIKEGATCETSGPFITKESCIEYYSFMFTMEGWIHREFECRNKTLFNVNTGKCENPCNWASATFTCKAEGRFPNPANCTQYHECIADETNPDQYSLMEKKCPYGYEWRKMENNVDHCVTKVTAMEDCVRPPRPDNCTTPNGWCTGGDTDGAGGTDGAGNTDGAGGDTDGAGGTDGADNTDGAGGDTDGAGGTDGAGNTDGAVQCEDPFEYWGQDLCIKIISKSDGSWTWQNHFDECNTNGDGQLMEMTEEQWPLVKTYVETKKEENKIGDHIWIGGHRNTDSEKTFVWPSSQNVVNLDFEWWNSGEPNDPNSEPCMMMYAGNGLLNDLNCNNNIVKDSLCQKIS